MVDISFNSVGQFQGVAGDGIADLANPTSLQFGPDGRLYVAEQNGRISAFTIDFVNGQYVATAHEVLTLPNGGGVVKSIMNHNDDGSQQPFIGDRQVTGIVVTGTATNPILYISSSDPRISTNVDVNLDTNSGVVTKVTWTGTAWDAVDIIRGLPRSEENHSVNGMVLSPDGTKLYLAVGGNTNNGAPSQFFAYAGEYALSGVVLEIDLVAINNLPVKIDPIGTQINGQALPRKYVYDLPTLDDPNTPNVNGGGGENANGLDEAGPWGGRDGLNMAILPADAPMRIYADGFRNPYDLVFSQSGKLFTVDNGSNGGLGGDPIIVNGLATNQPNNGGTGNPEPLFLILDGGYYGHPAPARSNQTLSWTAYNNSGTADTSLTVSTVPNLAALVPTGVNIAPGFLIDPSKFTNNPTRLQQSGIRVPYNSPNSPTLVNIGSSSNGLVEYTGNAFGGALNGALLVAQFNGTITVLNVNTSGTAVEPLIGPGPDGILGTSDDVVVSSSGVYTLITGLSTPLDVTMGPNGTIWVAEIGGNAIKAFAPGDFVNSDDFDNDGIPNTIDPFIRDASNGTSVTLFPGQTLLWDFDANQDGNLPGPNGYGGGLTGVMINGSTDFEDFFLSPATLPDQIIKLDNVKFTTAAGGGTTVIENVSNGDAFIGNNNGEYLFHTGFKLAPTIESFKVKWSVINPLLSGSFQQIGGYIGTGDQSNYLKFVAIDHPAGEIQLLLENNDSVVSEVFIQADDLFSVPPDQKIFFELLIDPAAGTASPTVTYEIGGGNTKTVTGSAINLNGTNVLQAILGNNTVQGQPTGIAIGLYSSNFGQPPAPGGSFQAIFTDIEVTGFGGSNSTVLYRVNAGGPTITAIDGGPNWLADTAFLIDPGSNSTASFPAVEPGATVPLSTPGAIFDTERWDAAGGTAMQYGFSVPAGLYEVRLYFGNGFGGTALAGQRVFDVAIEGTVLSNLNDIDLSATFGHLTGGLISNTVQVTDGVLNIEFLHGVENPLINGIEIIQLGGNNPTPAISIVGGPYSVSEAAGQVQVSLLSSTTVPANQSVSVTFQIVPGTATPQADYVYNSPTATFNPVTGVYTDTVTIAGSSSDVTFFVNILQDTLVEGNETFSVNLIGTSPNAQIGATSSTTVTIIDDDIPVGGNIVAAINAGGPAVVQNGINFAADTAFIGGNPYTDGTFDPDQPIFNGTIYETERFGNPFSYSIPVAPGNYTVELYFAEIFFTSPGSRVFDVFVEGQLVFDNLDILAQTGGDINQPFVFTVPNLVSPNTFGAADAIDISFQASADNAKVSGIVIRSADVAPPSGGQAVLEVTVDSNNVQVSNFGNNSFVLSNTGTKNITSVVLDVTNALYPDIVFDPFGLAGDNVAKPLTININGSTGVVTPSSSSYIGAGGEAGYKAIQLFFSDSVNGGFNPGESLGFSIDMDSNSIRNTSVGPLTGGTNPTWDVGGVSGAEMIGSTFTVTFSDGTTATGQLQGVGNQGGSRGLASQNSPNLGVSLIVNGLSAGGVGTYTSGGPSVIVNGPAGQTARIVLTKGFIQPVTPYAPFLANQLAELAATSFPANNAVEFQTVDVVLTGANQNITSLFDFSGVAAFNFPGENQLPLGFVASIIDPANNGLPLGPVTQPIYLQFSQGNTVSIAATQNAAEPSTNGLFTVSLNAASTTNTVISYSVGGTATPGADYTALSGTVTIPAGQTSATIPVNVLDDLLVEGSESVIVTLTGVTGTNVSLGSSTSATVNIADNDTPVGTLTVQAESITNVTGYRLESNSVASGGAMLSLVGGATNEVGTATFTFTGGTGTYNVILGTFDENDGVSTFLLEQNGTAIGNVILNQNLPGTGASAATKVEKLFAAGVAIANGDTFKVTGFENAGEHARFDFIRFEPVVNVPKQVSIAATQNAGEPSTNGLFTVSLSAASTTNTVISYSVGGTATPGADYTALSGTVTIPAGQTSATIPVNVLDDLLVEGSESVIVTLTGVTGAADVTLGSTTSATVTIADNDSPVGVGVLTVEAESITNVTGYRLESSSVASGGSMLSLVGGAANEVGTATFTFTGGTGTYHVILGTFDENDGVSTFLLEKNGTAIGNVTLNQNLPGTGASAATKVERLFAAGVAIANGDTLKVTGFENGGEHARFDFIRFVSVSGSSNPTPVLLEAEKAISIVNYRIENIAAASGGQALSFLGGASNEVGSATFGFYEAPGLYDVIIGTFDENDGLASFQVALNDFETGITTNIGSLLLNGNLGSSLANAQTKISPIVATGIALTPGDTITVTGFENGLEHARLDFLQLVPTV